MLGSIVVASSHYVARPADPVDEIIKAEIERQNIPGLSLVVLKDGYIIKSAGYGLKALMSWTKDLSSSTPSAAWWALWEITVFLDTIAI